MSGSRVLVTALLVSLLATSCTTRVIGGLDEAQANRAVSALEEAGIPASKSGDRRGRSVEWSVRVPASEGPRARQVLESLSLPRPRQEGFKGIVEKDSLVPSASRERLKETIARGQEISLTLESLEGVVEASVIIAQPGPQSAISPDGPPPAGTASALLKASGDLPISEAEVRGLVAGAVPGVDPEGVTVVVTRAPAPEAHDVLWATVGPFVVSRASRVPLLLVLTAMALLNLALGSWAVASVVRRRRAGREKVAG